MNQTPPQPGNASQFPAVGRWMVTAVPRGWMFTDGFGIRQMTADPQAVTVSIGLGEDSLTAEDALPEYIEKQKKLIEHALKNTSFVGPQPFTFPSVDESSLFLVRHEMEGAGKVTHIQTYARCGLWLGIITLTALDTQVAASRSDYDVFVKGLHICPPPQAEQANPAAAARPLGAGGSESSL